MDISPETNLSDTELSMRVQHALVGIGVTTIGQLSEISLKRVATAGSMGHKGIQELYEFCLKHALKPESRTHAEITGLRPDVGLTPKEIKTLIATQPHDQIRISITLSLSMAFCRRMHSYHINTLADLTSRGRDVLVTEVLQSRASLITELDVFLAATRLTLMPIIKQGA
ncbi:MAG TPA: hypothetical protein VNE63_23415 [Candidatus Acidoferrales bacterium]|nr:hypothetical protein [Candidatus Acidoferrales bacterium]